jgi:signal transduction histidine kinase
MPAWGLALLFGVIVLLTATGLDYLMKRGQQTFWGSIDASAGVAALVAALLLYRVLWYERERRKDIRRRLETIAEINHHIRNALHAIALSTHSTQDQQTVKIIQESLQRIDWALKEILPKL